MLKTYAGMSMAYLLPFSLGANVNRVIMIAIVSTPVVLLVGLGALIYAII